MEYYLFIYNSLGYILLAVVVAFETLLWCASLIEWAEDWTTRHTHSLRCLRGCIIRAYPHDHTHAWRESLRIRVSWMLKPWIRNVLATRVRHLWMLKPWIRNALAIRIRLSWILKPWIRYLPATIDLLLAIILVVFHPAPKSWLNTQLSWRFTRVTTLKVFSRD